MVPHGISAKRLEGGRHVVMLRRALIQDYVRAGVVPSANDAFNFSMWKGYLSDAYDSAPLEWCRSAGAEIANLHTSGHASAADRRAFANAVRPKYVVRVHGIKWDEESLWIWLGATACRCRMHDGRLMPPIPQSLQERPAGTPTAAGAAATTTGLPLYRNGGEGVRLFYVQPCPMMSKRLTESIFSVDPESDGVHCEPAPSRKFCGMKCGTT